MPSSIILKEEIAMKINRKWISAACAAAMAAAAGPGAFAYAPADYAGKYDLAVIARGEVEIDGSGRVEGSIYAADSIEISGSGNNDVTGTLIAKEIEIHENNRPLYEGRIVVDEDTAELGCEYLEFDIPDIENEVKSGQNEWGSILTVSEDTYFKKLTINDNGMVIDTTAGDVTIAVEELRLSGDAVISVTGGNRVHFYVEEAKHLSNLFVNQNGDPDQFNLYLKSDHDKISISGQVQIFASVYADAEELDVSGGAEIVGNVYSNAEKFSLTGSSVITGTVCVPEAETKIAGSGKIVGQLHTDEADISGTGAVIFGEGSGNIGPSGNEPQAPEATNPPEETNTPEVTEKPEESAKPEETEKPGETEEPEVLPPNLPTEEVVLDNFGYAYIFGYEPKFTETRDAEGNVSSKVSIQMAPNDEVTREQVCSMIMRLVDQGKGGKTKKDYVISDKVNNISDWAMRGVGYICSTGAYDDLKTDVPGTGTIPRGEVAKLVVFGLGLQMKSGAASFSDLDRSNPYKVYIDIMTANGYMQGDGETFRPAESMTRAEFCSMFNKVTGRENYSLKGADENGNQIEVTPRTYYFTDMDNADDWQVRACMLATSAFDENGSIDIPTRVANIRNVVDNYNGQKKY